MGQNSKFVKLYEGASKTKEERKDSVPTIVNDEDDGF